MLRLLCGCVGTNAQRVYSAPLLSLPTDMLNTVVTISIDLLAHSLAERFLPLFEVASRKSLRPWRVTPGVQAHVLVLDAQHANALGVAQARCVICIGEQARLPVDSSAWVSWLPPQFTVADLIGTLDRAAIFLHDQRNQKSKATAEVVARVGGAHNAYRITSWAVLPAPFDTPGCLRGMAMLSKGAVSLEQLCRHSQLDPALAQQLLQQLARRGLLTVLEAPGAGGGRDPARVRASEGLLQRFSKWVLMGGRA